MSLVSLLVRSRLFNALIHFFVPVDQLHSAFSLFHPDSCSVALKDAAAKALEGVESVGQESPVGDHQANGDIESAVRTLEAQMKATRFEQAGQTACA